MTLALSSISARHSCEPQYQHTASNQSTTFQSCSNAHRSTSTSIQSHSTMSSNKYKRTPAKHTASSQVARSVSESSAAGDNVCPICNENESIYAIAPCNHPICYKCSTRLRYLLHQFDCPICRADCPKVYFVHQPKDYQIIASNEFTLERKAKVWLEDQSIKEKFHQLIAHRCKFCPYDRASFKYFKDLQNHVKREHQHFFCEICSENVKLFSTERKAYDRKNLATHKRKGDEDDKSFKGHPLCQICDHRFLDTDELWRHLRKDHFYCHFCDADGEHIYFGSYDDVKDHFRSDHFLCEEDECANIQFTTAFRSELDFKAHKAQYHLKGSKRSQRQARTLELNFNYGDPRRNQRDSRGARGNQGKTRSGNDQESNSNKLELSTGRPNSRFTQEDVDTAKALAASLTTSQSAPILHQAVDMDSTKDFPTLPGESKLISALKAPKPTRNYSSHQALNDTTEYPSLSTSAAPALPPERAIVKPNSVKKPSSQAAVKPKSNPWSSKEDEFPSLEGTQSARPHIHSGWHIKKPEPKPVPKFINNSRPVISSQADFPTLGGENPNSSLASLASWINTNKPGSGKVPAPAPEQALKTVNNRDEPPTTTSKKKKKKKPVTDSVGEKLKSEETTLNGFSDDQAKGNKTVNSHMKQEETGQDGKSKANKTKTASNPRPSKKLAFLEVELSKDFPTLPTSSTTASTFDKVSRLTDPNVNVREVSLDSNKVSSFDANVVLDSDDYPSLSESKKLVKGPPPGLTTDKRDCKPAPPGLSKSAIPPGLTISTSKPPGLPCAEALPSSLDLNSIATLLQSDNQPSLKQQVYIEPVNFTPRNKKLSIKLKELIHNDLNTFHKFRNLTVDFRGREISAADFYKGCSSLLGKRIFYEILPELIALLPDISKQQELYKLCADELNDYHRYTELWSLSVNNSLIICPTCQQVVLASDFNHHELSHGDGLEDFPNLGNSVSSKPFLHAWANV